MGSGAQEFESCGKEPLHSALLAPITFPADRAYVLAFLLAFNVVH